jgi:hypothetical protein
MFEVIVVVGIWVVGALLYRIGYVRGRARKERMIWEEDGKRIKEYRSRPLNRQDSSGVPNRTIEPPKYDVVSEGYNPNDCIKTSRPARR